MTIGNMSAEFRYAFVAVVMARLKPTMLPVAHGTILGTEFLREGGVNAFKTGPICLLRLTLQAKLLLCVPIRGCLPTIMNIRSVGLYDLLVMLYAVLST